MLPPARLLAAALLAGGCFSAALDEQAAGAFACGKDAGDAPCPDGQTCSNGRCELDDTIPRVAISSPGNGALLGFSPDLGSTVAQTFNFAVVGGPFELVDSGGTGEHVFGEGHIVVAIDGQEQAIITSGSPGGGVDVAVEIPNRVGAHRFSVELRRNDGTRYDHDGGAGRHLFWFEDDVPRVAFTKPWPGDTFPLDATRIDVEIGVVNFAIDRAGTASVFRRGHAHIHYDDPFPECPDSNDDCDGGYFVITDANPMLGESFGIPLESAVAVIPEESGARSAEITAILRHVDHGPYRLPDDPDAFPRLDGDIVIDTITVERR